MHLCVVNTMVNWSPTTVKAEKTGGRSHLTSSYRRKDLPDRVAHISQLAHGHLAEVKLDKSLQHTWAVTVFLCECNLIHFPLKS